MLETKRVAVSVPPTTRVSVATTFWRCLQPSLIPVGGRRGPPIGNGLTIIAKEARIWGGGTINGNHEYRFARADEALRPGTGLRRRIQQRQRIIRELIRADQKRKIEERIDALLLEGLDSGEPIAVTQEYWDEKKRKLTERLGNPPASNDAARPRPTAADRDMDDQAGYLCRRPVWKSPCVFTTPPPPPLATLPARPAWVSDGKRLIPVLPDYASGRSRAFPIT